MTIRHLDEPNILMKDEIAFPEPKMAWTLSSTNHTKAETVINLGVIGDKNSIDKFSTLLQKIRTGSQGKKDTPLHVSFPGSQQLKIKFTMDQQSEISSSDLKPLEKEPSLPRKINIAIQIIREKIESLIEREPSPDLLVLAYPDVVDQQCVEAARNQRKTYKKTGLEKRIERQRSENQMLDNFLNTAQDKSQPKSIELYALIKLECMKYNIPIQIIRSSTFEPFDAKNPKREDDATLLWNLITALFYKANNIPWTVKDIMDDTCYVGITFFRDRNDPSNIKTSLAQIFSLNAEGYVIKGNHVTVDNQNDPHLSNQDAVALAKKAIDVYKRNNDGVIPKRIVIHKSSRFNEEERKGLLEGIGKVPKKDLLAFGTRNIKLIRWGRHPPVRGTIVKLPDNSMLLYTYGYIPYFEVYPGPRVPSPLEILEHFGDSTMDTLGKEILALTKLNWNNAKFCIKAPITIAFARKIGSILKEIPSDMDPEKIGTKFKFYM